MVVLNVKHLNSSIFLLETNLAASVEDTVAQCVKLHNGILKVNRVVDHLRDIASHGVALPPNMVGLLAEQIEELKLKEPDVGLTEPAAQFEVSPDPLQRRNGKRPVAASAEVLEKTAAEAAAKVSKENVAAGVAVTWPLVQEALDQVRGALSVVYPQGVPPYEPLRMELENREELEGTQASKEVIDPTQAVLWFASKELQSGKKLSDYLGKHEKTKVVVKLTTRSAGQPAREPLLSQEDQTRLMMANHRRKEELEGLDRVAREDDDSYLNSAWADPNSLKRKMHGVNSVSWK